MNHGIEWYFVCKFYRNIRTAFRRCICGISDYNIDSVLFDDNNLPLAEKKNKTKQKKKKKKKQEGHDGPVSLHWLILGNLFKT